MTYYARLFWTGILLFVTLGICEDLNGKETGQGREVQQTELTLLQAGLLPDLQGDPPLPGAIHLSSNHSGTFGNKINELAYLLQSTAKLTYARIRSEFLNYSPELLQRNGRYLQRDALGEYPAAG